MHAFSTFTASRCREFIFLMKIKKLTFKKKQNNIISIQFYFSRFTLIMVNQKLNIFGSIIKK